MRKTAFLLSLFLIFSIPWEDSVVIPGLGTATRIAGIGVAIFWLMTVVITNRIRKPNLFHILAILFVLWNTISIYWTADIANTTNRIITYTQLLILIYILWDLYTTRITILIALQTYIFGAYISIASTVLNYFSGNTQGEFQRYSATGFNPDEIGVILALGIPIAWYLTSLTDSVKISPVLRLVNYAFIPVALLAIALSGTRTALVALVPAMAYGLTTITRLKVSVRITLFLSFMLAIFLLLPLVPATSLERLSTTGTELVSGDLNYRRTIWREGLESFTEKPLLGIGSNMFRSINSYAKVAHNSFISVLVEIGIIGFALFAAILLTVFLQAIKQPKWDAYFWLAILATWFVAASALSWEHAKPTWLFMGLLIASAAITDYYEEPVSNIQAYAPPIPPTIQN